MGSFSESVEFVHDDVLDVAGFVDLSANSLQTFNVLRYVPASCFVITVD